MPALTPLATQADVESRLGRSLTSIEAARIDALLSDATAAIARYCHRDFQPHTAEDGLFKGRDSIIELPDMTTTAVHSVTAIGGGLGLPDVPIVWYTFDGIRTIRIDPGRGIINLPEVWWTSDLYPQTFRVNRDYGDASVPDDVVMVCANAALRVLMAPTNAAGVIGESIGPYSYRLERSGGGLQVALTESDFAALTDYRDTEDTIMMDLR
jgi:hypothetical protein